MSLDEQQMKFMDEEKCILVSEEDEEIGYESKKACHLNTNIFTTATPLLHRAFSVLLFDENNRLLLQRRAADKITFGSYWTNTCCSHPLGNMPDSEEGGVNGVFTAAMRKLEHELGIVDASLKDRLECVTRVRYAAPANATWGENEVDYIVLLRAKAAPTVALNTNEVSEVRYVSADQLKAMMVADDNLPPGSDPAACERLTPWFRLLCDNFLFGWWEAMTKDPAHKFEFETTIHSFYKNQDGPAVLAQFIRDHQ